MLNFISNFESNIQKYFLISSSALANIFSLLCYRNFAFYTNFFGLFSAISDFIFLFLLLIMTSYLIDLTKSRKERKNKSVRPENSGQVSYGCSQGQSSRMV